MSRLTYKQSGVNLKPGNDASKVLYRQSIQAPMIMLETQVIGNIPGREAYSTWNMGTGAELITPEPEVVIKVAARHGIAAQIVGEIREKPGITIRNVGNDSSKNELLEFPAHLRK